MSYNPQHHNSKLFIQSFSNISPLLPALMLVYCTYNVSYDFFSRLFRSKS